MISKTWIKRQPQFILDNLRISDREHKVYHISMDPRLGTLTPRIAHSQSMSEDRTVPRICVSLSLADAIFGYGRFLSASIDGGGKNEKTGANRDPIFHIYSKRVDGLVFPNDKLCGDASISNEAWLVADKAENTQVKMSKLGEFFLAQSRSEYGVEENDSTVIMLQVNEAAKVHLEVDIVLSAGWYKCKVDNLLNGYVPNRNTFDFKSITRKEYMDTKKVIKEKYGC